MQFRSEQLESQLARNLAATYLIHGDEPLLALEAADAVRAAARNRGYDEREVLAAGRGFDWGELLHAGANRSLFGGRKILELRIPGGKPGVEGGNAIVKYCARPNPDNLLMVTMPRPEGPYWKAPWFTALSASGAVVEVQSVELARLPDWLRSRLARNGQSVDAEAMEYLVDRVEGNLLAAHQEIQKLALLAPRGELDLDTVRGAVATVARFDPFVASDALLAGDMKRYVRAMDGLRGEGESPVYVLAILGGDLQTLARVQGLVAEGRSVDQAIDAAKVWKRRQPAIRAAQRRFAPAAVLAAVVHAARIDRASKGAGPGEPWDEFVSLGLKLLNESEGSRAAS
ncbi:MAG: DNA polymerase III subunit delta [Betaproteobacteria bacterium]